MGALLNIAILLTVVSFGTVGYRNGIVGTKFYFEKNFLSFLFIPLFEPMMTKFLLRFINESFVFPISLILVYLILVITISILLDKISKLPGEPKSSADKTMGLFLGGIRGFLYTSLFVFFIGVLFVDRALPVQTSKDIRKTLSSKIIKKPINYFRFGVFTVAEWDFFSNINKKSNDLGREVLTLKDKYNREYKW
ncbi:MAG: CvpA family protein [Candidatus Delongbacteria bacterium]|nr:CvpA family protein [Candidatus Delongbacteria bacterium]MBN2834968.1 CvpA family protein [Candidatus Delongbacteria bacterium]